MRDTQLVRRRFVRRTGSVVGIVALAGCSSDGDGSDESDAGDGTEKSDAGDGSAVSDQDEDEDPDDESDESVAVDDADHDGDETQRDDADHDGDETQRDDERNVDSRPVTIQSDAGAVPGTVYGDGECAVVLTPQINLDRESWEPQARTLATEGYLVLAIDPVEDDRPASVLGAVEFLQDEEGIERATLVGASIGGEASVVAAAQADGIVRGVVTISASGGDDYAGELPGQKLFVVAEADDDRFVTTAEALYDGASQPRELETYNGGAHGQRLFDTEHGEDLLERIVDVVETACDA